MTKANEHLDRAIDAGHAAVNGKDGFPSDWREQGKDYDTDRTYAEVLALFDAAIAELEGAAIEPLPTDFAKVWDDNPEGLYQP